MPIYKYYCEKCNIEFELLLFSGEVPMCPSCRSQDIQKQVSKCAISCGCGSESDTDVSSSSCGCSSCSSGNCSTCK